MKSIDAAISHLESQLFGQRTIVQKSLSCVIAGGHLLLEGPPGVGKTTLARGLSQIFNGDFRRVQMTSDILPSDILGYLRPSLDGKALEFRRGPIFCNFLLADELNRSTPKTQSALLEAMAENFVTIDGERHTLPHPFFVIATQNPMESHGVFPLAESELDRFSLLLEMDLPDANEEVKIYLQHLKPVDRSQSVTNNSNLTLQDLNELHIQSQKIFIEDSVFQYFYQLIAATRQHTEIAVGTSVRGAIQFMNVARSYALIQGRDYLVPQDLKDMAIPCLAHRIGLIREGASFAEKRVVVEEILNEVKAPR